MGGLGCESRIGGYFAQKAQGDESDSQKLEHDSFPLAVGAAVRMRGLGCHGRDCRDAASESESEKSESDQLAHRKLHRNSAPNAGIRGLGCECRSRKAPTSQSQKGEGNMQKLAHGEFQPQPLPPQAAWAGRSEIVETFAMPPARARARSAKTISLRIGHVPDKTTGPATASIGPDKPDLTCNIRAMAQAAL